MNKFQHCCHGENVAPSSLTKFVAVCQIAGSSTFRPVRSVDLANRYWVLPCSQALAVSCVFLTVQLHKVYSESVKFVLIWSFCTLLAKRHPPTFLFECHLHPAVSLLEAEFAQSDFSLSPVRCSDHRKYSDSTGMYVI